MYDTTVEIYPMSVCFVCFLRGEGVFKMQCDIYDTTVEIYPMSILFGVFF